ncbi:MAG TPA: FkbM family methyltransferase [Dongiaceae bacterium]|nr:FkbM family methyltransferase [Dongiaceae bacterium]
MLREEQFFDTEREIFSVLRAKGFSPKLIIDIGASDGSWTSHCRKIFPDPQYRLYEPLYSHLDHYRNGIDGLIAGSDRISVRPVALAEKAQKADFFITPHSVGSSLLPLSEAKKIVVDVATLDEDVAHITSPIDILKMDTQGAELRILRGAKSVLSRCRIVVVETWVYRGYGPPTPLAHEIVDELAGHDFRAFGAGGAYFNPGNVLYAIDLYFGKPEILTLLGSHPFQGTR